MIEEMKQKIIKLFKSSNVDRSNTWFFICNFYGFVDVLSNELKSVLERLLTNTKVKMYSLPNNEYAYDFI